MDHRIKRLQTLIKNHCFFTFIHDFEMWNMSTVYMSFLEAYLIDWDGILVLLSQKMNYFQRSWWLIGIMADRPVWPIVMILRGWEGGGLICRYDDWYARCMMAERWQMQVMADGHDSERQIGFCDGQTDWQTRHLQF